MKKYTKPTLNFEMLSIVNSIANSNSTLQGALGTNDAFGDKGVSFENFGTGEWN